MMARHPIWITWIGRPEALMRLDDIVIQSGSPESMTLFYDETR